MGVYDVTINLLVVAVVIAIFVARPKSNPLPYVHLPSKTHTRLVVFPAAQPNVESALEATLEVVDLAENPLYEAVSYVWGKPRFTDKNIYINGTRMTMRYNLWTFLQKLRSDGRPRKLWIDALASAKMTLRKVSTSLLDWEYLQSGNSRPCLAGRT